MHVIIAASHPLLLCCKVYFYTLWHLYSYALQRTSPTPCNLAKAARELEPHPLRNYGRSVQLCEFSWSRMKQVRKERSCFM